MARSIFALCTGIASVGMYICLLNQYMTDRVGRKIMLVITVLGMAITSILIAFSTNIIEFTIYLFLFWFFTRSDIWLIYVNEESPKEKRAIWVNVISMIGAIGGILAPIFRAIYITETSPVGAWRGMLLFPILLGIPLSILIFFTLKESSIYAESKSTLNHKKISFKENLRTIFAISNRKEIIAILIISFILGANAIFRNLLEIIISDNPQISENQISIIILFITLFTVLTFVLQGALADKFGRLPLLYIFAVLVPISRIIFVYGANLSEGAFIIFIITGSLSEIGYWGSWLLLSIIIIEVVPTDARGTATGLKSLIGAIGITVGLIVGSFITYFLGLGLAFAILSLFMLIIIPLLYFYIRETKGFDLSTIEILK
jgi:MFS family permease